MQAAAKEKKIDFDAEVYESVAFVPEPDGGLKIEYALRERKTASGVDGPGKGTITLPPPRER